MASSSRFSEDEEEKITEIIDAAIPENTKKVNHLDCLFSMVSFLIQTGWAVEREAIVSLSPAVNSN